MVQNACNLNKIYFLNNHKLSKYKIISKSILNHNLVMNVMCSTYLKYNLFMLSTSLLDFDNSLLSKSKFNESIF